MLFAHRPLSARGFYTTALIAVLIFACTLYYFDVSTQVAHHLREPALSAPAPLPIPKVIWYKLGPKGLSDQIRDWCSDCRERNPGYRTEILTDEQADDYVRKAFVSRPDIVETYLGLTIPILKADILRYLLLLDQGGIWFDLDVSCESTPIDYWIPAEYRRDANLVAGWEFDVGWGDHFIREFATWTIMARPGLPHMAMVIDDILENIREKMKEHNVSLADLRLDMVGDVVDITGPRRFTNSVLKSVGQSLDNTTIPIQSIAKLLKPKLVGDLLIMPGRAFAASSNNYTKDSPDFDETTLGPPLVTHHYAGTWKNDHGGEE